MYKILILGGSGLIGKAVISELNKNNKFQVYTTYFKRKISFNQHGSYKVDIDDLANLNNILKTLKPHSVISCLRGDFKKQLRVHIQVAEYLRENSGNLYFFSTANVFDNDLSKVHCEEDLVNSCTEYGKYKIECEAKIKEILNDNACILRLPQVWGKCSPRMNQLLESLTKNERIVIYPKLNLNINTDVLIARQLNYIIEHDLKGIFHLAAEDVINQRNFYNELILGLGFNDIKFQENYEEGGYFVLLSNRYNEFPMDLRATNKELIQSLIIDNMK